MRTILHPTTSIKEILEDMIIYEEKFKSFIVNDTKIQIHIKEIKGKKWLKLKELRGLKNDKIK